MPDFEPNRSVVPIRDVFRALGLGPTAGYRLARHGRLPVPVLRVGRKLVVPAAPLQRLLDGETTSTPSANDAAA